MATMNISLPDQMKSWIDDQVRAGAYASASDYVRDLVREHIQYDQDLTRLNELLDAGEASGDDPRSVDQIFDDVIAQGRRRAEKRSANG